MVSGYLVQDLTIKYAIKSAYFTIFKWSSKSSKSCHYLQCNYSYVNISWVATQYPSTIIVFPAYYPIRFYTKSYLCSKNLILMTWSISLILRTVKFAELSTKPYIRLWGKKCEDYFNGLISAIAQMKASKLRWSLRAATSLACRDVYRRSDKRLIKFS